MPVAKIRVDKIYGFGKYCPSECHRTQTVAAEVDGKTKSFRVRTPRSRYAFVLWYRGKIQLFICEKCWLVTVAACVKQAGTGSMDCFEFNRPLTMELMRCAD